MLHKFNGKELEIAYQQISIFNYGVEKPFSNWTADHIAQGFTLRTEAIGIMTLNQAGRIKTNIDKNESILDEAKRIYIFPFQVNGGRGIEIATIVEGFPIEIEDGKYSLLIQLGEISTEMEWCCFSFCNYNQNSMQPKIIRADMNITKRSNFLLKANPA